MKLVLLKIAGDGDFGALTFEQSGESLEECYKQMIEENVLGVEQDSDEPEWIVTIEDTIEVRDRKEAMNIVSGIQGVVADDWIGDYDKKKSVDWGYLIID